MCVPLHAINHGGIDQAKIGFSGFARQIAGGDVHTVKILRGEVPNKLKVPIGHRSFAKVGISLSLFDTIIEEKISLVAMGFGLTLDQRQ